MTTDTAHVLPDEVCTFLMDVHTNGDVNCANYYFKLAAKHGWSLRKIGGAVGFSAEAIRNRIKNLEANESFALIDAPAFPTYKPLSRKTVVEKEKSKRYVIPDQTAKKLSELRILAAQVSRNTPADAPSRLASGQLAALMHAEKQNGATYQEIAAATGLASWAAVKFRLGRHGYIDLPPSMAHERLLA